jgi:hypothetical protein
MKQIIVLIALLMAATLALAGVSINSSITTTGKTTVTAIYSNPQTIDAMGISSANGLIYESSATSQTYDVNVTTLGRTSLSRIVASSASGTFAENYSVNSGPIVTKNKNLPGIKITYLSGRNLNYNSTLK